MQEALVQPEEDQEEPYSQEVVVRVQKLAEALLKALLKGLAQAEKN